MTMRCSSAVSGSNTISVILRRKGAQRLLRLLREDRIEIFRNDELAQLGDDAGEQFLLAAEVPVDRHLRHAGRAPPPDPCWPRQSPPSGMRPWRPAGSPRAFCPTDRAGWGHEIFPSRLSTTPPCRKRYYAVSSNSKLAAAIPRPAVLTGDQAMQAYSVDDLSSAVQPARVHRRLYTDPAIFRTGDGTHFRCGLAFRRP